MTEYKVNDTALDATATAIQDLTGESAQLVWDAITGFADDIAAIATGFEVTALTASDFTFAVGKAYKSTVGTTFGTQNDTTKSCVAGINVSPGDIIVYIPIYDGNDNLMSCRLVGRAPNNGKVSETTVLSNGGVVTVGSGTARVYFNFGYTAAQAITMTTEACQLFAVYWVHAS